MAVFGLLLQPIHDLLQMLLTPLYPVGVHLPGPLVALAITFRVDAEPSKDDFQFSARALRVRVLLSMILAPRFHRHLVMGSRRHENS